MLVLQRQLTKLRNDLKTSNTQLSLVRQQKTKANDEVSALLFRFPLSSRLFRSFENLEFNNFETSSKFTLKLEALTERVFADFSDIM